MMVVESGDDAILARSVPPLVVAVQITWPSPSTGPVGLQGTEDIPSHHHLDVFGNVSSSLSFCEWLNKTMFGAVGKMLCPFLAIWIFIIKCT